MNILVNSVTDKVTRFGNNPNNMEIMVRVPDDFDIIKTIKIIDRDQPKIQKTNDDGLLLFQKPTTRTIQVPHIVGYEETTEYQNDKGYKYNPCMINVQKTNYNDELLYTETVYENVLIKYEETLDITEYPAYDYINEQINHETGEDISVKIQRVNDKGEPIYLIPIYEERISTIESTNTKDSKGNDTKPIILNVQKTIDVDEEISEEYIEMGITKHKVPIYLKPIYEYEEKIVDYDEQNQPLFEEVTYHKEAIEWEETTKTIKYDVEDGYEVDEDNNILYTIKNVLNEETGKYEEVQEPIVKYRKVIETKTVNTPTMFNYYLPVFVDNYIDKQVTLRLNPLEFTLNEVLLAKYQKTLDESQQDEIIADIFIDESIIDMSNPNHHANIGKGILQLLPFGEAKSKVISLNKSTKTFTLLELDSDSDVNIYINDVKFIDNNIILSEEVSEVVIKFNTTSDKPKNITSYAIGY